jgi:hypothetical protein
MAGNNTQNAAVPNKHQNELVAIPEPVRHGQAATWTITVENDPCPTWPNREMWQ